MKTTVAIAITLLVGLQADPAQAQPRRSPAATVAPLPPTFMTSTVGDIGRPFTVVDGLCIVQPMARAPAGSDPLEQAMAGAFQRARQIANTQGANGFIGYDIDFTNGATRGDEGRLLLCGTLVRIR